MADVPKKSQIRQDSSVSIETKQNQGTGRLTTGTVDEILTSSESHPHGIKVRLKDGQVGRVKKTHSGEAGKADRSPKGRFEDLDRIEIPRTEDEHHEFKEFYQHDKIMDDPSNIPEQKREAAFRAKKVEVQERFATAICAFGNKDGGFVFLGVRSDGAVMGLEKDRKLGDFEDYSDAFARHMGSRLEDLIQDKAFILNNLRMRFREIEGKTICVIQVLPASEPLFLHSIRGEEFYVRGVAPGATRLDGKERAKYISYRF